MPTRPATIIASAAVLLLGAACRADEKTLLFESDVRPILQAKCGKCHSSKVQKGALDLSTIKGLRTGGESGEPLLAESIDESYLWIMIEGESMPPEGEPQLTAKESRLIRRWLSSGAKSSSIGESPEPMTQHDVLPIVLLRCVTCHGARLKRGGQDLRTPQSMRAGGDNGPALVPGDPDASLMIKRIESEACPRAISC